MVWLYGDPAEAPNLQELTRELLSRGLEVQGPVFELPPAVPDVVGVILRDTSVDEESLRTQLEPWAGRVVPIALGGRPSPVLGELSQVVLNQSNVSQSADRIVAVAEASGVNLEEFYRLARHAHSWNESGRPSSGLMNGPDLAAAERLLRLSSTSHLGPDRELLRSYVERTQRSRSRRRRVLAAGAAVVSVVLVLAALQAQASQAKAGHARDQAVTEGSSADSIRLATSALDLAEWNSDLPAILASRAIQAQDTAQAKAAGLRIRATTVPHRSYPLKVVPISLATGPTGSFVIGNVDGTIEVHTQPGDQNPVRLDPVDGTLPEELLPTTDGRQLAEADDEATLVREIPSGGVLGKFPDVRPVAWIDGNHVLTAGRRLQIMDITNGVGSEIAGFRNPRAWAVSPDNRQVAIVVGRRVHLFDLNPWSRTASVRIPKTKRSLIHRGVGLAYDGTGKSLVVAQRGTSFVWDLKEQQEPLQELGVTVSSDVASGPAGYVLDASSGTCTWLKVEPSALMEDADMPCHSGAAVVGMVALDSGQVLSAGGDSYLRAWSAIPVARSPQLADASSVDFFNRYSSQARRYLRGRIRVDDDGSLLVMNETAMRYVASMSRVDPSSLALVAEPKTWVAMDATAVASEYGAFVASSLLGRYVSIVDVAAQRAWQAEVGCFDFSIAPAAVSNNGNFVTCQSRDGLVLAEKGSSVNTILPEASDPIDVTVTDTGETRVVTASGEFFATDGTSFRVTPDGTSAVAATQSSHSKGVIAAAPDGSVYEAGPDGQRTISRPDPDLAAFATTATPDYVVLLGASATVVLDRGTGEEVLRIPTSARIFGRMDDAVVQGQRLFLLDQSERLVRIDLSTERLAEGLSDLVSRSPTEEEILLYQVPAV